MKNFKDIIISIFAIIGLYTVLTSFDNKPTPNNGNWQLATTYMADQSRVLYSAINIHNGEMWNFDNKKNRWFKRANSINISNPSGSHYNFR